MDHIDHIVINSGPHIDKGLNYFESMGFTVTPRGYHSFGYSEGKLPVLSFNLVQRPPGLVATAVKIDDAQQTRTTLISRGFMPTEVLNLSRPLDLGDGNSVDVKFHVIMLESNSIPGTEIFYCQHLTPQFVWRSEWQTHANGCTGITRLIINVDDREVAILIYQRTFDIIEVENTETNSSIIHLSNFELILITDHSKPWGMQTVVFSTDSLEKVETILTQSSIDYYKKDRRILANTSSSIGCAIEFESAI